MLVNSNVPWSVDYLEHSSLIKRAYARGNDWDRYKLCIGVRTVQRNQNIEAISRAEPKNGKQMFEKNEINFFFSLP